MINAQPLDPLWYKDAIIYETHVRCFFDSTGDGVGDFPGLTAKLDYLQELGVTVIWLLPFYPSPLRDDGYDIAHYEGVHPNYGTLRDFKIFLREAHDRGLRVITELVINHTSDQHAWFQAARRAPAGSSKRNYYVWSPTKQRYEDARIIFTDSEQSNWTWDPVANAYYWHRFFHHQPDLNFDNPRVRRAVLKTMRFWLDQGVDGLRLDAVPYLIERDGTNCENLPETHVVLKEIRAELDARYGDRMLLAEANQWPADVRAYFGDADECHMAFHFPLMPRMFMAVRQEDRHPITEILRQTPDIPDTCQWAIFLRNHDELTLEMVTDEERDYMYQAYAADRQMRINVGIRRRLAPLMENDRARIELLNSLLFSLPGTPIIYYGDEIGMGDNIFLGDRNGVRTPMQWTSDRNGGFSRADPARLYAPPIMDPVYGYQAINVEAQQRSPFSLLNWMKRLIALRKSHKTLSRGTLEFLYPQNRRVLAYVRRHGDQTVLAVANLARSIQPVELDLSAFAGVTPIEMMNRAEFPRVGTTPYFLTLGPYASYWFQLERTPSTMTVRVSPPAPEDVSELPALITSGVWDTMLDGTVRLLLDREYLLPFLRRQRWFAGKARDAESARIADWVLLQRGAEPSFLTFVDVTFADQTTDRYFVPLAVRTERAVESLLTATPQAVVARVTGARKGAIVDGMADDTLPELLLSLFSADRVIVSRQGAIVGTLTASGRELLASLHSGARRHRGSGNQSNSFVRFGDALFLKIFRRLEPGPNPDLELTTHLSVRAGFTRVPRLAGGLELQPDEGEATTLAMLQAAVQSQGEGWERAIHDLGRFFEHAASQPSADIPIAPPVTAALVDLRTPALMRHTTGNFLDSAETLGRRTAEMHLASSDPALPDFGPELFTRADAAALLASVDRGARDVLELLERLAPTFPSDVAAKAAQIVAGGTGLLARIERLGSFPVTAEKSRVHGDYHLGQVLWVEGDFIILDFEGEPSRPLRERRAKQSPLKDVAGMLRSFSYAAYAALFAHSAGRPEDPARLEPWAALWERWNAAAFLRCYLSVMGTSTLLPANRAEFDTLLHSYVLEKVLYELHYELNNRPDWVRIPLWGLQTLMNSDFDATPSGPV